MLKCPGLVNFRKMVDILGARKSDILTNSIGKIPSGPAPPYTSSSANRFFISRDLNAILVNFVSGRISEGKLELQKLLKIFLDKDQKHFLVGEELSLSTFLLRKDERALRSLAELRFLAEIKVA